MTGKELGAQPAFPMPGYPIGSRWALATEGFDRSERSVQITDTLKACAVVRYASSGVIKCVPYGSLRKTGAAMTRWTYLTLSGKTGQVFAASRADAAKLARAAGGEKTVTVRRDR